ncbi:hypothetical protein PC112_g11425 [Phytophthora cactorum]|nr:hypothetical protein PC112_g11425 [Phytophthora cactorum]
MENALLRSIREGQDSGTYLVLDADVADAWPELCISPFGCVPKADADSRFAARLIHDLSFPRGSFVNDASDPDDLPPLTYEHVGELALRIESTKSNKPREFLRVQFDEDERAMIAGNQFSINLREQLSAVFAVLCWWSVVDPDKDVYTDIHPLLD